VLAIGVFVFVLFLFARKAVEEYFGRKMLKSFLHRIDLAGRLVVKPASVREDFAQLLVRLRLVASGMTEIGYSF
jgi:hypothetical protein